MSSDFLGHPLSEFLPVEWGGQVFAYCAEEGFCLTFLLWKDILPHVHFTSSPSPCIFSRFHFLQHDWRWGGERGDQTCSHLCPRLGRNRLKSINPSIHLLVDGFFYLFSPDLILLKIKTTDRNIYLHRTAWLGMAKWRPGDRNGGGTSTTHKTSSTMWWVLVCIWWLYFVPFLVMIMIHLLTKVMIHLPSYNHETHFSYMLCYVQMPNVLPLNPWWGGNGGSLSQI